MFKHNTDATERGVSPVVGVILMVAITVVLAAVIGLFVLGMADLNQNPSAAVTVDQDGDDVTITIISMDNADTVSYDGCGETGDVGDSAGQSATITCDGTDETVTITADLDGEEAVIKQYDAR